MARYVITTKAPAVVDGQPNPDGLVVAPAREMRAVRKARKLQAAGNPNVMLFQMGFAGAFRPVSPK